MSETFGGDNTTGTGRLIYLVVEEQTEAGPEMTPDPSDITKHPDHRKHAEFITEIFSYISSTM